MRENGRRAARSLEDYLAPREIDAAYEVIRRVIRHIDAELVWALLFGSKARRQARPDSDIDILLIFRELPPDREPQATQAEDIADDVAKLTCVPVTTWSVALIDLELGLRTPMLVDALDDGIPLWPAGAPPLQVPFSPPDALRCTRALLQRVAEGSEEVHRLRRERNGSAIARRVRDDVVRLCTALLLLRGETRPRRGETIERFVQIFAPDGALPDAFLPVLVWAADSFGPSGKEEDRPVPPPPGGLPRASAVVDYLRQRVVESRTGLASAVGEPRNFRPADSINRR